MITVSLEWIAQRVNGELFGPDRQINNVTTDSRNLQQMTCFSR